MGKKNNARAATHPGSPSRRRVFLQSAIVVAAAIMTIAALFLLSSRPGDRVSGRLVIRPGAMTSYVGKPGSAASLHLQGKGDDIWGFFEYPGSGIYGFIAGSKDKGRGWRGRILAGTDNVEFQITQRFLGIGISLVLEPQGKPSFSLKLRKLRPRNSFGIESYEPRKTGAAASEDRIEIVQISSSRKAFSEVLDSRLRRGESPSDNADSLLQEFERSSGRLPQHSGGVTLMQRPYLLYFKAPYASIASETYIFQGGAHGITVSVFNTINMETGKLLEPSDFFEGDWQIVLPRLIAGEAARQLAGVGMPGKNADAISLSGFGLFEDELPIPSGIFPCAGGFGFHYNRYEIAPGAMGEFLFILPSSVLDNILKPEWKQ